MNQYLRWATLLIIALWALAFPAGILLSAVKELRAAGVSNAPCAAPEPALWAMDIDGESAP